MHEMFVWTQSELCVSGWTYQQSHVSLDMFFTCNLNRVSSLCTGLVHYITGSVHFVKTEVWDRDRWRNRNTEKDTVHLNAWTQYLNKSVQRLIMTTQTIRYTVWRSYTTLLQQYLKEYVIGGSFKLKMPILLHNSLLKIDNKQRYHGRRFRLTA